jgi:hypothetical protein
MVVVSDLRWKVEGGRQSGVLLDLGIEFGFREGTEIPKKEEQEKEKRSYGASALGARGRRAVGRGGVAAA